MFNKLPSLFAIIDLVNMRAKYMKIAKFSITERGIERLPDNARVFMVYGFNKPKGMEDLEYIPMYLGADYREAITTAKANEGDNFSKILVKETGVGCLYRWVHPSFTCSQSC
jgi:hypothetical protein